MKKVLITALLLAAQYMTAQINVEEVDGLSFGESYTTAYLNGLSTPRPFLLVRNSDLNALVYWNGSAWVELGAAGTTYTFGTGLTESSGTVTVTNPFTGDAAQIADGSVSNAEFQRLDGATAPVLTQANVVNNLTSTSTVSPLGAGQGKILQDQLDGIATGATVGADWDTNLTNIPANLDLDGTDDVNLTGNQTISGLKTFAGLTIDANLFGAPINSMLTIRKTLANSVNIPPFDADFANIYVEPLGSLSVAWNDGDSNENWTLYAGQLTQSRSWEFPDKNGTFAMTSDLATAGTDDQTLSLSGTDLSIENGNTVDLSGLGGGSGDVTGPASSTDNAIARFDGVTGKLLQGSGVTIDDDGNVSMSGNLLMGNDTIVGSGPITGSWLKVTGSDDGQWTFSKVATGGTADSANDLQLAYNTSDTNAFGGIAPYSFNMTNGGTPTDNTDVVRKVDLDAAVATAGTDDQTLSVSGTDLSISGGNTVDLSSLGGGSLESITQADYDALSQPEKNAFTGVIVEATAGLPVADDQALSLAAGNILTLEDGGTVDLTPYLDNTDDQAITAFSLDNTTDVLTLTLENGGTQTVDFTTVLAAAGTDDQTLSLGGAGNTQLSISGGNTVDLVGLGGGGTDDQTAAEVSFTPNGSISATNVQAAIQEVRDEAGTGTDDQTLSLSGTDLSIENGNTVDLSGLGGAGAVESVNGEQGVVLLNSDDIPEGTSNLYSIFEPFVADLYRFGTNELNISLDRRASGAGLSLINNSGSGMSYLTIRSGSTILTTTLQDNGRYELRNNTTNPITRIYPNAAQFSQTINNIGTAILKDAATEALDVNGNIAVNGTVDGVDVSELNDEVVKSDITGITGAVKITNFVAITQADYDALVTPPANTYFIIIPE